MCCKGITVEASNSNSSTSTSVVDDSLLLQCLKYKTDQQVDVKKMEKLNSLFFVLMARGEHPTGMLCCSCATPGRSASPKPQ
jgi:hypothetical protein